MTKQQYKIFTAVRKYKKLGKVLEVTKVGDYIKLQETVGADMLDFSDVKYDDDTDVTLSTKATDEYESRKKGPYRQSSYKSYCWLWRYSSNYFAANVTIKIVLITAVYTESQKPGMSDSLRRSCTALLKRFIIFTSPKEFVDVCLRRFQRPLVVIVFPFNRHVVYHADGQQIKIAQSNAHLHAAQ